MSILRITFLGTYLAGILTLVLGLAIRLGMPLGNVTPRGALVFSIACFLCTLATGKVEARWEKRKQAG